MNPTLRRILIYVAVVLLPLLSVGSAIASLWYAEACHRNMHILRRMLDECREDAAIERADAKAIAAITDDYLREVGGALSHLTKVIRAKGVAHLQGDGDFIHWTLISGDGAASEGAAVSLEQALKGACDVR